MLHQRILPAALLVSLTCLAASCKGPSTRGQKPAAGARSAPAAKTEAPAAKTEAPAAASGFASAEPAPAAPAAPVPAAAQEAPRAASAPASGPASPASPTPAPQAASPGALAPGAPPSPAQLENVVLHLTDGQLVIRLFEADCPKHCENFKRLVRSGYYNGVSFHRVCAGFVQGGDPTGTGKGGAAETIPAEIKRVHMRGALVAARKGDEKNPEKASHGSQFFIMKKYWPSFNGQYTVFGQVIRGFDVLDRIPLGDKENDYLVPEASRVKIVSAEIIPASAAPMLRPSAVLPSRTAPGGAPGQAPGAVPAGTAQHPAAPPAGAPPPAGTGR